MVKKQKRRRYRRSRIAPDTSNLNFRLPIDEKKLLERFADDIIRRHPQWNRSDVWKELMGITRSGIIPPELRNELYDRLERLRKDRELPTAEKPNYIHAPVIPFTRKEPEPDGHADDESDVLEIAK